MSDDVRYPVELVRRLLHEQHTDLADLPLAVVDGGYDNQTVRLGYELAVRLPRSDHAAALIRTEQRWLPVIIEGLPLQCPALVRTGKPTSYFAYDWSVLRWVEGEPADRAPVAPGSGAALADFLQRLHRPAPTDAPPPMTRGMALADLPHHLDDDDFALLGEHADAGRRIWRDAVAAPAWQGPPMWLHGDLHPANVVTNDSALTGIIDFGDLCTGDPACDLGAAWVLLPDPQTCLDAYGADEAMVTRARGWALLKAMVLLHVGANGRLGLPGGKPTWEPAGHATLGRLVQTSVTNLLDDSWPRAWRHGDALETAPRTDRPRKVELPGE